MIEAPKELKFKCNNKDISADKDLSFNNTNIAATAKGKHTLANYLIIECKNEFANDKLIDVVAVDENKKEHLAGQLRILANDKNHRYHANVLFVGVQTNIGNGVKFGLPSPTDYTFVQNYLGQALISAKITPLPRPLDVSGSGTLNSFHVKFGSFFRNQNVITTTNGMHDFLDHALQHIYGNIYDDYYKVYFIGEGANGIAGQAKDIVSKAVIGFNPRNPDTIPHELMHALGLYHSFDNDSIYTFTKATTENVMDYSQNATPPIRRISSWRFQWKIMQSNAISATI